MDMHLRGRGGCTLWLALLWAWLGFAVAEAKGDSGANVQAYTGATRAYVQNFLGNVQGTITLSAGLRFDQLDWSIAGAVEGANVNILSELEWSQVLSHQIMLSGRARVGRHFYGSALASYAWIQSGTVRDSDYAGNNRAREFSRSISDTDGDHLWDVMAGAGYPFIIGPRRLLVAPMLGYSVQKQNFRITNGEQVISTPLPSSSLQPPAPGPLDNRLNSTYRAMWRGPWIGCDLRYQSPTAPVRPVTMEWGLSILYHFLTDYSADATWNLRSDFRQPRSFEQTANGHGVTIHGDWLLRITPQVNLALNLSFSHRTTDSGIDTLYLADGRTVRTRLNPVTWQAYGVMVGLACRF